MNFVMGSPCFLQSPLYQSLTPSSSYPPCLSFCSNPKNVKPKKKSKNKSTIAIASLSPEGPSETKFNRRRGIFLLGISYFSFIQSKARAADALTKEEQSIIMPGSKGVQTAKNIQKEKLHQGEAQPNPFVALLTAVGILGSGVLGALYALAQKEKAAAEATIESVNTELSKKEAAMVLLRNSAERMLLNEQEERAKQIRKVKEEQQSLLEEVASVNNTVTGLQKELQNERRLVEEFKVQMDRIQTDLRKAVEDKNILEANLKEKVDSIEVLQERINLLSLEMKEKEEKIRNLNSSLVEKEMECKNLDSICKQAKADLAEANMEMKAVKEQLFRTQKELDLKNSVVDDLNSRIHYLNAERDDNNRKFDGLQEDYNNLKLSSEKKAASDAELLAKRGQELHQLEEKLELAFNEVNRNQASISNLMQERNDLKKMLEIEVSKVKNLKYELQNTKETLGVSRVEISDLSKELKQSRKLCKELEFEVLKIRADFTEVQESLKKSLDEARSTSELSSSELASAKALLKNTKEELQIVSSELADVTETRDKIKKELVDVYKKAESAAQGLKEEKQRAASLKEELQASEKKILKDKEARKRLEMDVEEATKSLNEMNRNALMLSRDLEMANSRFANLEEEKDIIYNSLVEQKNVSQEARENVEDAHNLVMKLGKDRESFEKRAKKLEEELASAKGEILRLRSKMSSSRTLVNDPHQEKFTGENNTSVAVKRISRRRKGDTQSDAS
ncbi:MAR-binding filament-like protein 1-1 [Macadamia integrifolia]|uniref:MAR-binding filament-like protein 1-1 n=1 Tax=Macadamia integrifolia TaxID=60698 RepID=UPI001C4F7827|nr:MAR-binding filament-like protein 1-1 [Macadamia integrifolia]